MDDMLARMEMVLAKPNAYTPIDPTTQAQLRPPHHLNLICS